MIEDHELDACSCQKCRTGVPAWNPRVGERDERVNDRALVEAGYMPLADYVAKYESNGRSEGRANGR